jgi:hypothetical protein
MKEHSRDQKFADDEVMEAVRSWFNPLALELDIYSLAHHLRKM